MSYKTFIKSVCNFWITLVIVALAKIDFFYQDRLIYIFLTKLCIHSDRFNKLSSQLFPSTSVLITLCASFVYCHLSECPLLCNKH